MVAIANAINAQIDAYFQLDDAHREDAVLAINPDDRNVSFIDADDMIAADILDNVGGFDDSSGLHYLCDLMKPDNATGQVRISQHLVQTLAAPN
jgi:hypothetical protein